MAKGQKRSNRELRKPKANKKPLPGAAAPSLPARGFLAPSSISKKKA